MNDTMWIYKNSQGLKVLENELEALRRKRYNRSNKFRIKQNTQNYEREVNVFNENFMQKSTKETITTPSIKTYNSIFDTPNKETIKNQETANRSPIVSPHIVTSPMPLDRRDSDKCSLYLPQLSPEHKFTADDLSDISTEDLSQQRPLTKKRVSFNEELTFIPSDEEHEVAEKMDEGVVIKELLFALNHTPVEKKPTFVPQQIITSPKVQPLIQKNQTLPLNSKRESTLEKKRETKKEPQKLSNRLLDMFQPKKPKSQIDLNNIQPTQELNHPTKYRPRKPPSLKKTLTFPAATAQPDWRVRSTTKKFEFAA